VAGRRPRQANGIPAPLAGISKQPMDMQYIRFGQVGSTATANAKAQRKQKGRRGKIMKKLCVLSFAFAPLRWPLAVIANDR
jgi:hypothetical protein